MSKEPKWKKIEARYGAEVVRFLKQYNIKVTGTGFYKLPNIQMLDQCSKLSVTTQARLENSQVAKKRRIEYQPEKTISPNCYALPENVKRIINIDEKKWESCDTVPCTPESPSVAMNMEICLDKSCHHCCIPEGWVFAETNKRYVQWDYEKMFKRMVYISVGRRKAIDHIVCLNEMKSVLQKFEDRHNKFRYFVYLEIMLQRNDRKNPRVSIKQIQSYFSKVFANVIPQELFGRSRNVKKLKKALHQYFLASWGETICLKPFVSAMDISSIVWLRRINDEEVKWLIIAKVVKWLFEVYFVAILKSVFKVQKDLHSQEKHFLCAERWKRCKFHYVKIQEKQNRIAKKSLQATFPENNPVPSGSMTLFPKSSGVRGICMLRFDRSPEGDVAMLKSLLQQLYHRKYHFPKLNEFHHSWLRNIKKKKENPDYKVYVVSSDITDAYGSVNQNKLYNILHSMIDEIQGESLPLEWLALLTPNNAWKRNRIQYKYWFTFDESFPRIQSHALVTPACDPKRPKRWVPKEYICALLKAYILQQTVWYKGTEYILKKGLAQGSPLSPILSELYYAHMMEEEFGAFSKSGYLSRFVDDFLYVTDNEESAKRFIVKINHGIRKYHCRFNPLKTKTNVVFANSQLSKFVTYLGYRIDCTSMEITPAYADLSFRHFPSMHRIFYRNELQTFVMRMRNFSTLKLTSIVLDTRINSSAVILSTASSAGHAMALRCATLLCKIFDKFGSHVADIWDEIRASVQIVTKMFVRRLGGYNKSFVAMKRLVFALLITGMATTIVLSKKLPPYAILRVHTPGNDQPAGTISFTPAVGTLSNIDFQTSSPLDFLSPDDLYVALVYDSINNDTCTPNGHPLSVDKGGILQPMVLFYLVPKLGRPDNYLLSPNSKASFESTTYNIMNRGIILYRVPTFRTSDFTVFMDWQQPRTAAGCGIVAPSVFTLAAAHIQKSIWNSKKLRLRYPYIRLG